MNEKDDIVSKINELFGGFDEFEKFGYEYVCWVISQDLKDMKDDDYLEEQCKKEFADIMINIIRKLSEEGYDYKKLIHKRLDNRMKGNAEDIVDRYTSKYMDSQD